MRLATLDDVNERATVGGNLPPSQIDFAREAMSDLSRFLTDNPVIQNKEQADQGGLLVERTRKTIQDLEDERKKSVSPLNEQVGSINEQYRTVRDPLDSILSELRRRLTDHVAREEAARIKAAMEARAQADAAEMEARRAEADEQEAKQNATFGEVTDVAEKIVQADQAYSRFTKADRAANIAERDTSVRISSQLGGKALGLRTKETLHVDDPLAAVEAMLGSEVIHEAILTAARYYRKLRGELPPGVRAETTRSI